MLVAVQDRGPGAPGPPRERERHVPEEALPLRRVVVDAPQRVARHRFVPVEVAGPDVPDRY